MSDNLQTQENQPFQRDPTQEQPDQQVQIQAPHEHVSGSNLAENGQVQEEKKEVEVAPAEQKTGEISAVNTQNGIQDSFFKESNTGDRQDNFQIATPEKAEISGGVAGQSGTNFQKSLSVEQIEPSKGPSDPIKEQIEPSYQKQSEEMQVDQQPAQNIQHPQAALQGRSDPQVPAQAPAEANQNGAISFSNFQNQKQASQNSSSDYSSSDDSSSSDGEAEPRVQAQVEKGPEQHKPLISITPVSNDLPPATPEFIPKEVQKSESAFEEKPSEIAERMKKEKEEEEEKKREEMVQPEIQAQVQVETQPAQQPQPEVKVQENVEQVQQVPEQKPEPVPTPVAVEKAPAPEPMEVEVKQAEPQPVAQPIQEAAPVEQPVAQPEPVAAPTPVQQQQQPVQEEPKVEAQEPPKPEVVQAPVSQPAPPAAQPEVPVQPVAEPSVQQSIQQPVQEPVQQPPVQQVAPPVAEPQKPAEPAQVAPVTPQKPQPVQEEEKDELDDIMGTLAAAAGSAGKSAIEQVANQAMNSAKKDQIPPFVSRPGERILRKPKNIKPSKVGEPTRSQAPLPHIVDNAKILFEIIESGNLDHLKEKQAQMQSSLAELYDLPYYQNAVFKAVNIKNEQKALDMVMYLYDQGCKVDYVDFLKQTPLYYAAKDGKCKLIKFLLEKNCCVNHIDTYGQTPLFYTAKEGHLEAANFLIESGADPDFIDHNKQTPLYYAIKENNYEMCEFLLQRGANPNNSDKKQVTPFVQANRTSKHQIQNLLIDFGASDNQKVGKGKKKHNNVTPKKDKGIASFQTLQQQQPAQNTQQAVQKMDIEPAVPQEKVHPSKEQKRYVLSKLDAETGVHIPLTKEEIVAFIVKFQGLNPYFNSPEKCAQIPLKAHSEGEPIYDHWRKAADKVMKELWKHKDAWIFYEPVDPIKFNIPDYYNIIKEPMDLGTLKNRLKQGLYSKPEEFEADMLRIFSNCILYNGETAGVSLMCLQVKQEFQRLAAKYQLRFYCE